MDFISTIISILASAFGGAFAAFKLQEYRDEKKEIKKRSSYIRETLFSLSYQKRILEGLKEKIEPYKDDPLNFLKISPFSTTVHEDTKIEVKNVYFLLNSKDPDLLIEITKCQEEFAATLNITSLRSLRHNEELPPIFNKLEISEDSDVDNKFKSKSDLYSMIGISLTEALRKETNLIYTHVYKALTLIPTTHIRLRKYAIKEFPNEKFPEISG